MKKGVAILVALLSIPFLTLAILFLIASAGQASRFFVALAFGVIGVALLVTALKRLRRLAALSPDVLRTGAVELARRLGGELTVSQLRAEYNISFDEAQDVLEGLLNEDACEREDRAERTVYVFHELMPSLAEKVCPYCGTELPVRDALRKCPNCGATLEITKT